MKSLSQKQNLINTTFQQGQKAIQLGLFNKAEQHFLAVLKINSSMTEAHSALAYIYTVSKQHAKASSELKLVLKANPKHAQTQFNLANSLYEQQLYDDALKYYKTAFTLDPSFVDAHINCGIAYRMLKDYDAAIASLHQALNLDKKNARAFHVLGMIYVDIEDYNRALHCLESATGLAPNHAKYRVSFATALEKANLDFEAGLEYHRACETDPNYMDSFTLYGSYLLKGHRHDEALECIKRSEVLAPRNADIYDKLGQIYLGMNDTEAAITQYHMALEIESKRIDSLLGLGQVYQELGDSNKGIEICDEIISIDPNKPNAYLLKSRMKKSKSDDGLADQLIKFTSNNTTDDDIKHHVHFALGKIYDDQNNFAEAFKHYALGNELKNKKFNYSAEVDENRTSKLIETFNTKLFCDFKHLGVESNLPIIIVGMPRSGTTLNEQIISSHPKVMGAGEVAFWGKAPTAMPLRLGSESEYPECVSEMTIEQAKDVAGMYESTLRKIAGAGTNTLHITDKMPHNFRNLGLIALLFPNVKIIHTMRNSIDTCLSIFFQNFNAAHDYASDLKNLAFHYRQYQRFMCHWHEVLPGRILDINYEDTIAEPEYWSRKLINHVGLEWNDACLAPHKLERTVKTASHWQVRQPIYKTSMQRWKNYEPYLSELIEALKD